MATTQRDIARKLNVSVMTVSKALNNAPDISKATKRRVLKLAKETNYSVNTVARSLVQKKTNTIGVIFPDISERFYGEMLRGIEAVLKANNFRVLIADSDNDSNTEKYLLYSMVENRVDGLIFCPTEKTNEYARILVQIGIPYVIVNSKPSILDCDSISVNRGSGAQLAIEHLIKSGYKDLYFFYTFEHMNLSKQSVEGCKIAFNRYKTSDSRIQFIYCPDRELKAFYETAKSIIKYRDKKIGIFSWDDEMAIGIYRAIIEKGYNIPNQVGLVGFDNIEISKYLPIALTTINYPKSEMGKISADLLIKKLNAVRKMKVKTIELELNLIKRESSL